MVSFDIRSLFITVPLEKSTDITLERIYHQKEIETNLTENEMKNLLLLCTKICISMVELENMLIRAKKIKATCSKLEML